MCTVRPAVPAGVDRPELDDAVLVRRLGAAQVGLLVGSRPPPPPAAAAVEADSKPEYRPVGVAVPDVDDGVLERLARARVAHPDGQPQRRALAVLGDVAADRVDVEVVRPLGQLGA